MMILSNLKKIFTEELVTKDDICTQEELDKLFETQDITVKREPADESTASEYYKNN